MKHLVFSVIGFWRWQQSHGRPDRFFSFYIFFLGGGGGGGGGGGEEKGSRWW